MLLLVSAVVILVRFTIPLFKSRTEDHLSAHRTPVYLSVPTITLYLRTDIYLESKEQVAIPVLTSCPRPM